jgi:hypothetical protein
VIARLFSYLQEHIYVHFIIHSSVYSAAAAAAVTIAVAVVIVASTSTSSSTGSRDSLAICRNMHTYYIDMLTIHSSVNSRALPGYHNSHL